MRSSLLVFLSAMALTTAAGDAATARAALVDLHIERDGVAVFSPRMLVPLGERAEASITSPTGTSHRVVLQVAAHDKDAYSLRSRHLTKAALDANWVVASEPQMVVQENVPASITLADANGKHIYRMDVRIRGENLSDLGTQSRGHETPLGNL